MTPDSTGRGTGAPAQVLGKQISFNQDGEVTKASVSTRGFVGHGRSRGATLRARGASRSGLSGSIPADSSFAVVIEQSSLNDVREPSKEFDKDSTTLSVRRPGQPRRIVASEDEITSNSPYATVGPPGNKRRGGRPRKNAEFRESGNDLPAPKFVPFICEWMGCKAELHNIDTLRKHIFTVHNHVDMSGGRHCYWAGCGSSEEVRDNVSHNTKIEQRYFDFAIEDTFKIHVEKKHLQPFAWHVGDGPKGSSLDGNESDTSSFLMDASGKQVTPSVIGQTVESRTSKATKERYVSRRLAEQKWNYHPEMYNPPNELFPSRIPGRIREVVIAEPQVYAIAPGPGGKVRYSPYAPRQSEKESEKH